MDNGDEAVKQDKVFAKFVSVSKQFVNIGHLASSKLFTHISR